MLRFFKKVYKYVTNKILVGKKAPEQTCASWEECLDLLLHKHDYPKATLSAEEVERIHKYCDEQIAINFHKLDTSGGPCRCSGPALDLTDPGTIVSISVVPYGRTLLKDFEIADVHYHTALCYEFAKYCPGPKMTNKIDLNGTDIKIDIDNS